MPATLDRILSLEVPIIVQLGERLMPLGEVLALSPGAIIELPKGASEALELLVNNRPIGQGTAVKVGENFGLKVSRIGDTKSRVNALGEESAAPVAAATDEDAALADLAAQLLAGQS